MNFKYLLVPTFVLLFNCVPIKNLYSEKIEKHNLSIFDKNKIQFNGYYFFSSKQFNQKKITALIFNEDGTILRTWQIDFVDFKTFENYLLSQQFQDEINRKKNTLVGNYKLENEKLIGQFEIKYGMRENFIETNEYLINEDGNFTHTKSFGEDIVGVDESYEFKEFKNIDLLKKKIKSIKN